jgi:hypothetical protein
VDFGPILILLLVIGFIIFMMVRRGDRKVPPQKKRYSGASASLGVQDFRSQWQRIGTIMQQPGIESTRSAIFEADKLLDAALRHNGFRGETMGERLKNAREHFGNNVVYQGLWEAHKMRNAMAHELGFDLPKQVAQQNLEKFEAGLRYLKVL